MLKIYLKILYLVLIKGHRFSSFLFAKYFLHDKFSNELVSNLLNIYYDIVSYNTSKSRAMTRDVFLRSTDFFFLSFVPHFTLRNLFSKIDSTQIFLF